MLFILDYPEKGHMHPVTSHPHAGSSSAGHCLPGELLQNDAGGLGGQQLTTSSAHQQAVSQQQGQPKASLAV